MLNEGFKRKYEAMDSEISKLQKEIELNKKEKSSAGADFFDGVGNVVMSVFPSPGGKLAGLGIKLFSTQMK